MSMGRERKEISLSLASSREVNPPAPLKFSVAIDYDLSLRERVLHFV